MAALLCSAKENIGTKAEHKPSARKQFFHQETLISGEIRQVSSIIA
ncbi:MAG: hypothetical protein V8R10_04245 [Christensenellales bacterium]